MATSVGLCDFALAPTFSYGFGECSVGRVKKAGRKKEGKGKGYGAEM